MKSSGTNLLDTRLDDKPEGSATSPGNHPQDGVRTKILIVDDEPCVSELLGEMLELLGHASRRCNSPIDALGLLETEDFDVILSDFRMPHMNGDQFYTKVIQRRPELARRMVFLTGDLANDETQAFLAKSGALSLEKPFQLSAVEQLICRIIGE